MGRYPALVVIRFLLWGIAWFVAMITYDLFKNADSRFDKTMTIILVVGVIFACAFAEIIKLAIDVGENINRTSINIEDLLDKLNKK